MENMAVSSFIDGEWESLCSLLSFEEPDFGAHFLGHSVSSVVAPFLDGDRMHERFSNQCSKNVRESVSYNFPSHTTDHENCQFLLSNHIANSAANNYVLSDDLCMELTQTEAALATTFHLEFLINEPIKTGHEVTDDSQSGIVESPLSMEIQLKRKHTASDMGVMCEASSGSLSSSKKKPRVSKCRGKRSVESEFPNEDCHKKDVQEVTNAYAESSTHCDFRGNSDEESNTASQKNNEGENSASKELVAVTVKGKKRASRGAATDPQSLYARRRRQRINERLRTLQGLVPNGTKVDISTMLEEAVHYVKFLQLQIRLLSSDDLWMYAPVAYSGGDISQYKRIFPFLLH